jgi:hypothetical protein
MKYIIFKGHGCYHPVLFADHTTHSQIKLEGCTPVSAGFVKFGKLGFPQVYGNSESLKLKSRGEEDESIIRNWQMNMCTSSFLVYE